MSDRLWLDRETWNEIDLKVVGTSRYAETAEDLMISYAIGDGPARVWDCTAEEMHDELFYAMEDEDGEVWAHNAWFDRAIHNGPNQLRLPRIELDRWRCSMAMSLSHALPGGLDDLCRVLKISSDLAKIKDGKKLVQLFCKPQPENRKIRRATRLTHPTEWARFKEYAGNDILAMRACVAKMPSWNWNESAIAEWHLDQRINERGFQVDQELTRAGARAAIIEKERIGVRFRELTRGIVARPSQRAQFQEFVKQDFGIELEDTTKATFTQMLRDPSMDPRLAELMNLSMAANKTSTAKYAALDPAVGPDGRFRGGLQFAGASRTRRWAGRLFQPQNLPSRGLPKPEQVEDYIQCLKQDTHALFFDDLMLYGAAALRGCVIAAPTKKLAVADLSNIEGRVLAWLAQENWKLQAFRDFDAGTGADLYNITAVSIIGGDPWAVPKHLRNSFGKVPDLASGYQGGVAGYQTFAKAYGVKMADFWDTMQERISPAHIQKAWDNLSTWGHPQLESLEISELEWVASETCKLAWRARHPATNKFWYALGGAAKDAIKNPGKVFHAGPHIKMRTVAHMGQKWLVVALPSGRYLTYFEPHLVGTGRDETIAYWGEAAEEGQTNRQWIRVFTHGGKMTGNCLSESAKILTNSGAKRIVDVQPTDLVWDGIEWVSTDGVVSQGEKGVGEWLGLQITPDHLIHDGNSWRPVMQLDERSTQDALLSAASSVHLPSFTATQETVALQTAFANAGPSAELVFGNCGGGKACVADNAPVSNYVRACAKMTTSLQTTNCEKHGQTGTSTWCDAAQCRQTPHTKTTEAEAFTCTPPGSLTAAPSFHTSSVYPDGTNRTLTWTEKTTTAATNQETSGLLSASSTAITGAQTDSLSSKAKSTQSPRSGAHTATPGGLAVPSFTTLTSEEVPSGLWRNTGQTMQVYDLLNCGPRNRFTVLTDFGPVVVHNCCQTIARDILAPALQVAENRNYLPVLTVHDEILTEAPDNDQYSAAGLVEILATNPPWAAGLPLAAAGFETKRYYKD